MSELVVGKNVGLHDDIVVIPSRANVRRQNADALTGAPDDILLRSIWREVIRFYASR